MENVITFLLAMACFLVVTFILIDLGKWGK